MIDPEKRLKAYPKLLAPFTELFESPHGLAPVALAKRIFEIMIEIEPSIADAEAFSCCELGMFARRGLHERVRKDLRNLTLPTGYPSGLFADLDLRYTVPDADGGARQIEHAHMNREEWLMAEGLLFAKANQTLRKAHMLEQCRLTFDRVWRDHPDLTSKEAFRKALARESGDLAASGLEAARHIEHETV